MALFDNSKDFILHCKFSIFVFYTTSMPDNDTIILRKHKLTHFQQLTLDRKLLQSRFSKTCSMNNCTGNCCRYGVWVDVTERDAILVHTELILRHMELHQEKNPAKWFEPREIIDHDFPSGRAIGTQERETGCVFLDSHGRCVLQTACTEEGLGKYFLKPFFCVAYPITIEDQQLTIDKEEFPDNPQCCSAIPNGHLKLFDVCKEELEFTLGTEGFQELRRIAETKTP